MVAPQILLMEPCKRVHIRIGVEKRKHCKEERDTQPKLHGAPR